MDSRQLYIAASRLSSVVTWNNDWIHFGTGSEIKFDLVIRIVNDFISGDTINFVYDRTNSQAYSRIDIMNIIAPHLGVHDFQLWNIALNRVIRFSRIGVLLTGERNPI